MTSSLVFVLFVAGMLLIAKPVAAWLHELDYRRNCPDEPDLDGPMKSKADSSKADDPLRSHPFAKARRQRRFVWTHSSENL